MIQVLLEVQERGAAKAFTAEKQKRGDEPKIGGKSPKSHVIAGTAGIGKGERLISGKAALE